ncbi:MAG TPA: adenosylcobinamide-GDP ribazoletransferase [Smithellaceae bacterium]|nr:adenosylcobinamide-GDP ribazoletransferase [Smithellaceae bacterium]
MKRFLAALQFLTVVPLPASLAIDERDLGRSVPFFPLVGLGIGAAAAGLDYHLGFILPIPVVSVFTVIFLLAASGGLHMDGLADTADGFFSSRPREEMLDIMRDSRTGPMGVMAIVLVLILKIALLASLPASARWWVLLLMPLAGRCGLLVSLAVLPYARAEGGLASIFYSHRARFHALLALAFVALAGWLSGSFIGVASGIFAFLFSLGFAAYVYFKIGGFTGDTLGAACELTELIPPLACVIAAQRGWVG